MSKTKSSVSVVGRSAARLVVALGVTFGTVAVSGGANAGPTSLSCTTDISGTVNTNVIVPAGEFCALDSGAVINGNTFVEKDGTLFVGDGVTINGNVDARSGSGVLMGTGATLYNYSANGAASAIVNATVAGNVSLSGGSFGLVGEVSGRLTCNGAVTGAAGTTGASNSGCTIADGLTLAGFLVSAAQKGTGTKGGGTKPLTCAQAVTAAGVWLAISEALSSIPGCETNATCTTEANYATGTANGLLLASCGNPT